MYQILSIKNYEMTRDIKIRNTNSGTIEICFDDSALISSQCFDFLKAGNEYMCKIMLFGNIVSATERLQDKVVLCKVICRDVIVGRRHMVKVGVNGDEYYVNISKSNEFMGTNAFYFKYSRKDLIQVDDVVHADLL